MFRKLVQDEDPEIMFRYFKKEIAKGWNSTHFEGRLMLLIKDSERTPSNANLRPISISSTVIKTFEQILKNRLEDILEASMAKQQIGFVRLMGCEVHL